MSSPLVNTSLQAAGIKNIQNAPELVSTGPLSLYVEDLGMIGVEVELAVVDGLGNIKFSGSYNGSGVTGYIAAHRDGGWIEFF